MAMIKMKLTGVKADGSPAKTQEASEVVTFIHFNGIVPVLGIAKHIDEFNNEVLLLTTSKGQYKLFKHSTLNQYQGKANGHKVHCTLKKITGELRYW